MTTTDHRAMTRTVYYRRTGRPYAFPAVDLEDIEVTDEPQETGPADGDWKSVDAPAEDTLAEYLGLDGRLTDAWLIADAIIVGKAIAKHCGFPFQCDANDWPKDDLDDTTSLDDGHAAIVSACQA